ncbi:MAG: hypothetical protein H7Y33_14015 [Cytophagales bacterium]|nr:hypothetical protein [Rhizobacter sp.]
MIPRIDIDPSSPDTFEYRVSHESEPLFDDGGFSSVLHCLVAAVEGLSPEVVAVEVAYGGYVSGTYPLEMVAMNHEQVAAHAINTTAAIQEALGNH